MALDNFRRIDMKLNKANYYIDTQMAKEGDYNGRELVVQITDDGEIKNQTGVSLSLGWRHDTIGNTGLDPFSAVDISKGIFKIAYPTEMLNAGVVTAVIQVVENGRITLTRNFKIAVEKNPLDEDAIVSENSFSILQDALKTVGEYDSRITSLEENIISKNNLDEISQDISTKNKLYTETDYVDITSNFKTYDKITFIKTHDAGMQQFDVYLKNSDTYQKMTFTKPDDYFKLSGVRMVNTNTQNSSTSVRVDDLTYSGDWYLGTEDQHINYARKVGATAEHTFATAGVSDIKINYFTDNRGGIFNVTLDGQSPKQLSTYSSTAGIVSENIYSNVAEGTHTIKFEFLGDDPNNVPSTGAGTSRGWLISKTNSGSPVNLLDITGEENTSSGEVLLMSDTSNKEFAFSIAPMESTNFQWVPQHANRTGIKKSEPIFILDGIEHRISNFNIGQEYDCKDFKIVQDIYGRNPDSAERNLLNVNTVHSLSLNGKIHVSGSIEFLEDVKIASNYVIMAPVNNRIFEILQSGWGNQYDLSKTDNSSTFLPELENSLNYVYLNKDDYFVAFRHTNGRGNLDIGGSANKKYQNFINHRDADIVKHYLNIFDNQVMPNGYRYTWSGDYVAGKMSGAYNMLKS